MRDETFSLIDKAVSGNKQALENLVLSVEDSIYKYTKHKKLDNGVSFGFTQAMEKMDELSLIFSELPKYRSPEVIKDFLQKLLRSDDMITIKSEA